MHLLPREQFSMDEQEQAVDLDQSPADMLFLSFSDSDLASAARVYAALTQSGDWPSLRLANLTHLKHPFSVDLYLEKTAAFANIIVVRCLGGADYWRYGVTELARLCREKNIALAFLPGDGRLDLRLDEASTLSLADVRRLSDWFSESGPENLVSAFGFLASAIGKVKSFLPPKFLPAAGYADALAQEGVDGARGPVARAPFARAPFAFIIFYRSHWLAADIAPLSALGKALAQRGFTVKAVYVASLKDAASQAFLRRAFSAHPPAVILNATSFSAREEKGSILDAPGAPVLQTALAATAYDLWRASARGVSAADLAMNIVLPETDGRLMAPFLSFKQENDGGVIHRPVCERIEAAAALAANWAQLARKPRAQKRFIMVLSDYPARAGYAGYAVGLDTPASVEAIVNHMRAEGFNVGVETPLASMQIRALLLAIEAEKEGKSSICDESMSLSLEAYNAIFLTLPQSFQTGVCAAWGPPEQDEALKDAMFFWPCARFGALVIVVQPDRSARAQRRDAYHDTALPPRHAFIAFYLAMRRAGYDAMIHLGAHGVLEWLPGKAAALSGDCAPTILTHGLPVIYPFIVNDPGEAAQARRRLGAVTLGHMTPPLIETALSGAAAEIEHFLEEYAQAALLDPRRARLIADAILEKATGSGLAVDCGLAPDTPREEFLRRLDAWICDVKELRIGDGLHVYGAAEGEWKGLLAALDGRFVPPGPSGAPSRMRKDILPTGRNLFSIDPRALPTRAAWEIGVRAAQEILTRYVQDEGDWPRAFLVDLWGSVAMRTGGEDFAQAFALIGARPRWDCASARVSGFDITPLAALGRPRIDVTLRASGLFRDVFPALIALFDQAARAIAALDESDEDNPLAAAARAGRSLERIFGPAPQSYGVGLTAYLSENAEARRTDLGAAYLQTGAYAYGCNEAVFAPDAFAARVKNADALIHTQDMAEIDILSGPAFADYEGGFLAAADSLGATPRAYHLDSTIPDHLRARNLREEIARAVRGRLSAQPWLEGQMRHGWRGASEIAQGVGNLLAFGVATHEVSSELFECAFSATFGDARVRAFLQKENPPAARQIARDFQTALRRGLWKSRSNSAHALIHSAIEDLSV